MLCLIQYTWQALTYDKTAFMRSGTIVLPMWQNAVSLTRIVDLSLRISGRSRDMEFLEKVGDFFEVASGSLVRGITTLFGSSNERHIKRLGFRSRQTGKHDHRSRFAA